jgi:prophage antirepressor-like protein
MSENIESRVVPFTFEKHEVRVIMMDGDPWWVAKDVCDALEIQNSRDAITALADDEKLNIGNSDIAPLLGLDANPTLYPRGLNFINESGLYVLIVRSNKPAAKKFRKWITSEVLPQIRKTGAYTLPGAKTAADQSGEPWQVKYLNGLLYYHSAHLAPHIKVSILHALYALTMPPEYRADQRKEAARTSEIPTPPSQTRTATDKTTWSATDLASELGMAPTLVGKYATRFGLKIAKYGQYKTTVTHSGNKPCQIFLFNAEGRAQFLSMLADVKSCA